MSTLESTPIATVANLTLDDVRALNRVMALLEIGLPIEDELQPTIVQRLRRIAGNPFPEDPDELPTVPCITADALQSALDAAEPRLTDARAAAPTIHGVTWLLIRDGCVLLERCEKKARVLGVGEWFVPGGKLEGVETEEQALRREIGEEWPDVQLSGWTPLPIVEGSPVPPGPRGLFLMRPFLITASGYYPDKSSEGTPLRWTPIAEALASPVLQVRMMVAAAMDARAATSAEPVAWAEKWPDGKHSHPAIAREVVEHHASYVNDWIVNDKVEVVPLYSSPAPPVAALRGEIERWKTLLAAKHRGLEATQDELGELRDRSQRIFDEQEAKVASLSAALEAITERSSYPIDPRDAFEEAISRARAALPTGDATR
jgi:hypothetical protein